MKTPISCKCFREFQGETSRSKISWISGTDETHDNAYPKKGNPSFDIKQKIAF